MIKGAIFDVDGTLLDSMGIWENLAERYLLGKNIQPEEKLSQKLAAFSLEESAEYLKETYALPESPEIVKRDVMNVVADFYRYEVSLKPGARELLEKLKMQNISMCVATTGDKKLVRAAFKRLGIDTCFQNVFTCTELGTTKREPYIFEKAAESMGCRPEETVVFEDALHALESAASAGFVTAAVAERANERDAEKIRVLADCYLEILSDWTI